MNRITRTLACSLLLTAAASPAFAQAKPAATLKDDLLRSVAESEEKLLGLANALSAEQYNWRPSEGVRSAGEVFMHVAADNYLLPAMWGVAAPAATKITSDYTTAQAFEKQKLDKAATIAALTASFDHIEKAIGGIPDARMTESLKVFGQETTVRGFLILSTTHLSEHLGQMIAYARSNKVTPPWSK